MVNYSVQPISVDLNGMSQRTYEVSSSISTDIIAIVGDNPFTVQLNFEPKGILKQ